MTPFKERMNLYRTYRELNPDKNYWDWKASRIEQDNDLGYQEWKRNLPENLRYESPDYDLYGAYKAGMQPTLESDGTYHLGSRDPQTGRILKQKGHPTYLMAIDAEKAAGYDVYEGDDGEMYSKAPLPNQDLSGWLEFKDYYNSNELGAKERQQLRSWYRRRKAYAERTGNAELLEQLRDDGKTMSTLFGADRKMDSKLLGPYYFNVNLDNIPINVVDLSVLGKNIGGIYHTRHSSNPKGSIDIPNNYRSTDLLHEYTHALNSYGEPYDKTKTILTDRDLLLVYPIGNDSYWLDPREVHSRLMELRHTHDISPLQKVTKDDLKKMRESGKSQHAILDYFADDDLILDLLNRVADAGKVQPATNSVKTDILATLFGGVIPAMLDGGNTEDARFSPIDTPVIPKSHDLYYTDWQSNWLNRRREQLYNNLDDMRYSTSGWISLKEQNNDIQDNKWNYDHNLGDYSILPLVKGESPDRVWINKEYYKQLNNAAIAPDTTLNASFGGVNGAYVPLDAWDATGHYIVYPEDANLSTKIHERTHASNPRPQEEKILNITGHKKSKKSADVDYESYIRDPREVYARLMQFRHDLRIDPSKVFGAEDLNTYRKELEKYNLHIFSDDQLLRILNEVASNDIRLEPLAYSAKNGGIVPAMQNGGENKPLLDPTIKTIIFPDGSTIQTSLPWANQQGLLNTPVADMFNPANDAYDLVLVGKDATEGNWAGVGAGLALAMVPNAIEKPLRAVGRGIKKRLVKNVDEHVATVLPEPTTTAIAKDVYAKDVHNYYIDDVFPRMIDNQGVHNSWIEYYAKNPDNFLYNIQPNTYFRNKNVSGRYTSVTDEVALNEDFANTIHQKPTLVHENRHRLDSSIELTDLQTDLLRLAYRAQTGTSAADMREMVATNTEIRSIIYDVFDDGSGKLTPEFINNRIDAMPDHDLLDLVENVNVYGNQYSKNLRNQDGTINKKAIQNVRNALKYVPALAAPVMIHNTEDKSN